MYSHRATTLKNDEKFRLCERAENGLHRELGGEGGIRTHGGVSPTTVFETAPFDRSGTSPSAGHLRPRSGGCKG